MAVLLYHMFAFSALFCYGIYHLVSATRFHLKASSSPHRYDYHARPYHPLPLSPHRHHLLRHLPIYLAALSLLLAAGHHFLSSSSPDPLLRGRTPVHHFTALQSAAALLLFLLTALSVLLSHSLPHLLPLPNDLLFFLAAVAFALLSAVSGHASAAYQTSDLQSKCDAISSLVSAASAALALSLAFLPRLFVAELALAGSVSLQGLWSLQTGLSLYVEGFIPDGCHRLLDVQGGIEGSTRCDLEETRLRAAALLDLAFVMHVTFVAVVAVVVYAATARAVGVVRRHGSYEALPTSSSSGALNDLDHVQMKQMTKTNMQQA